MTTFVLVHGAFRGGWSWDRVRPLLEAAGHEVHAPTLSETATGLDTWVDEVAAAVDDDDVVLVGHSQGGVVVREVAVRRPSRLRHLVYLDAAVPDPGERAVDVAPAPLDDSVLPPRDTLIPSRPLDAGWRPGRGDRRVDERAARADAVRSVAGPGLRRRADGRRRRTSSARARPTRTHAAPRGAARRARHAVRLIEAGHDAP